MKEVGGSQQPTLPSIHTPGFGSAERCSPTFCMSWDALPWSGRSLQSSWGRESWVFQSCSCSWRLAKHGPDEMRVLLLDR